LAHGFAGFPRAGLQFLSQLKKNNSKEWFHEHKDTFEESVKAPMVALVSALDAELSRFAPEYVADPKRISRMNRDTRFSADKSPYRTDISIVFPRNGGEKAEVAGFYVAVSPEGVEVLGGVYMPGPEQLTALRNTLLTEHARFQKLVEAKALREAMGELQGEKLVRVPRGFAPEHPAADLLRFKQFYFSTRLPASAATSPELVDEVARRLKLMTPFVSFLDEVLEGAAGRAAPAGRARAAKERA